MKFNLYVLYILFAVFIVTFPEKALAQMPPVQWGTYYGDIAADYGNSVATDEEGNVYLAGHTRSTINIAAPGAAWPNATINPDVNIFCGFLVKFNSSGVRQWATYIPEEVNDIACDKSGNVYLTGKVNNAALVNISTVFSHQPVAAGGQDAFLMKLSPSGAVQWSTYYGGAGDDFGNSIAVDVAGDIYITGTTESDANIATAGTHKPVKTDNFSKIFFLAKFNSSGARQWGTYYGSEVTPETFSANNEAYSINVTTDIKRNVYICGTTQSTIGIATTGTHQSFKADKVDAFIAKFTGNGTRVWGTYYGGDEEDWAGHIVCDLAGNIYLSGLTGSTSGISTPGTQQPGFLAGNATLPYNMMLVKFTPNAPGNNAIRSWGTYYGRKSAITGFSTTRGMSGGLAVDPAGLIYMAGANGSKGSTGNFADYDATLSRYEPTTGKHRGDTTIGTPGVFDFGAAVAVDPAGNVFLVGSTRSTANIATPDGFRQQLNRDGSSTSVADAFLIKFKNSDTTVYFKDLHLLPTSFCVGDTFSVPYGVTHPFRTGNVFTVQLYNTVGGFIDIGSRAAVDSGRIFCTIPDPMPLPNYPKIRIIASNPKDTTVVNALADTISKKPEFDIVGDTVVCAGIPINLLIIPQSPPPGVSYLWNGPQGFTASTPGTVVNMPTPDHSGFYRAAVFVGSCRSEDSIYVKVNPRPDEPEIFVDSTVCEGDTLFLKAVSTIANVGFHWNGPNGLSQGTTQQEIFIENMPFNGTGVYYVAAGIANCYSDTVSAFVRVKPEAKTTLVGDSVICEGDTLRIDIGNTTANDSFFRWLGPNGFTSFDSNVFIPNVPYDNRGMYTLETKRDGCSGFDGYPIRVTPKPVFMATSNSPIYEGEDLKLDITEEKFPGIIEKYKWLGPGLFRDSSRSPVRDSVDPDRHVGNYHITATSAAGCEYVGITNVIIYRLNYDEFILYPIPNNGNFTVRGTVKTLAPIHVEIANSANQLIGYDIIYPLSRTFKKEYWLEDNLANGQYYFRARVNGKWKVIPFTIGK